MTTLDTGKSVKRKLLACAVDISDGGSEQQSQYHVVGYKVGSADLEFNIEKEEIDDILGDSYQEISKIKYSMTFDAVRMTDGPRGKLADKILDYQMFDDDGLDKLTNFKTVLIFGMYGEEGSYKAVMHDACTITSASLGGEGFMRMPLEVAFGGEKTLGTADGIRDIIKFIPTPKG